MAVACREAARYSKGSTPAAIQPTQTQFPAGPYSKQMQIIFVKNRSAQIATDRARFNRGANRRSGSVQQRESNQSNKSWWGLGPSLAMLSIVVVAGCQTYTGETLPESATGQHPGVLTAGDTIRVSFTTAPELNQSQKIESDGRVSLPLIGQVYATGKTTDQLQLELTSLYKPQLQNSEVLVTLENVAIPVVVSGEVQKPGKIVFERPATVLEAIMEAGGFTAYGDPKRIAVIRQVNGVQHTQIVDLSNVLHGQPSRVMYVSAGDVIYVRPRFVSF
jgi:polysaccharide biosynthesis/export protein